jgi:hypothetical protein
LRWFEAFADVTAKGTSIAIWMAVKTIVIETVIVHAYACGKMVIVYLVGFASRWLAGPRVRSINDSFCDVSVGALTVFSGSISWNVDGAYERR